MNKIEALKAEKDGLEIQDDLVRFAREGWKTIGDDDKERLKWVGVFMRRPTPGHAMMRIRMPNGVVSAPQVRLLARLTRESGRTIADITTRQQIQLRWVTIERVPEIIRRLEAAGLSSLQTGMDNIRGIIGCPATGLTPGELHDILRDEIASSVPEMSDADDDNGFQQSEQMSYSLPSISFCRHSLLWPHEPQVDFCVSDCLGNRMRKTRLIVPLNMLHRN
jgi:sulfite reductase beta subunit-like hemoprotein